MFARPALHYSFGTFLYSEIIERSWCEYCKENCRTEEVKDAMLSIAEIIYMQLPLRYQDAWLEDIREKGMWQPEVEIEEGMKKE